MHPARYCIQKVRYGLFCRYKTEYCKQGPGCNRKICFFAHRPEEIRTAPTVVFTKQGPFIDSATTARNKSKLENAYSAADSIDGHMPPSPWNPRPKTHSGSLNNTLSYGDPSQLASLSSLNPSMLSSPRQQFAGFNSTRSMGSQRLPNGYEDTGSLAEIQAALSALSTMNSTPTTPFGDVSPPCPQTPTTPWSTSARAMYDPFACMTADSFSHPDQLLTYLQGLQRHHLSQTPHSISEYLSPRQSLSAGAFLGVHGHPSSASWNNDLMNLNLAQMMNTEVPGESILYSSLSDGVIHRGGPTPGSPLLHEFSADEQA